MSCVIFGTGTYAATVISSNNISYVDNANLGVDNVQAAIDGTCTKFSTQLSNLKGDIVDTMYPVGSIYISEEDATPTAVQNRFKTFGKDTTWEKYGEGKTLVGEGKGTDSNGTAQTFSVKNNNKNLGEYSHELTIGELAKHNHNVTTNDSTIFSDYIRQSTNPNPILYIPRIDVTLYSSPVTTDFTGNSEKHNNIQPYTTVYMYKRTK